MLILGINEGINSSVVVVRDGRVEFALQEERVTRQKEHVGFPDQALAFTLKHLGLQPSDFDAVCLSNQASPLGSRSGFLRDYDLNARTLIETIQATDWRALAKKLVRKLPDSLRLGLRSARYGKGNTVVEAKLAEHGFANVRLMRFPHHSNHAACAYYGMRPDPREKVLVLTLDGGGDDDCSHVYLAENGRMTLLASTPVGHSLGQIYARITHMMGMTPHEHEYKLMGMAPYAEGKYMRPVVERLRGYVDLDPAEPMRFKRKVPEDTTFIEPRMMRDLKRVRFDSLAGGIQAFTEEMLVKWVKACIARTGVRKVVAAGGVFMNVKANKLIAELPEVEFFDVFPSCGDETLSFGAAWQGCMVLDPAINDRIAFDSFYLGPDAAFDLDAAMAEFGDRLSFETMADPEARIAGLLAESKVVARCSGPMEFGARALGNRSLLADASDWRVVARINKAIKQRDFWMPFAPASMVETAEEYVTIPATLPRPRLSPYMMHTFATTEAREQFVAGTHPYDGTARLQVVRPDLNAPFHTILRNFRDRTGKGIVLNTSFNLHGFPIVMGARDAMDVMMRSGIEYLAVGNVLAVKKQVP